MADQPDVSTVETDDATDEITVLTGADDSNSDASASAAEASDNTDSDNTDSGQAGEGNQNTPPEVYADFVLPEGIELNEALLGEATPLFKELELTQEQAQKLVDFQAKQVQADEQGRLDSFNQLKQEWVDNAKSDKEIGGDKFEENVGVAMKAVETYGTPELKQLMDDYGIGNHPEIIRFAMRVGATLKEDVPGSDTTPTSPEGDRVTQLYGS